MLYKLNMEINNLQLKRKKSFMIFVCGVFTPVNILVKQDPQKPPTQRPLRIVRPNNGKRFGRPQLGSSVQGG